MGRVPRTTACDFPVPHHTPSSPLEDSSHRRCSCARGIKVRELVSVSWIFSSTQLQQLHSAPPTSHSPNGPSKSQQAPHPQVPASSLSLLSPDFSVLCIGQSYLTGLALFHSLADALHSSQGALSKTPVPRCRNSLTFQCGCGCLAGTHPSMPTSSPSAEPCLYTPSSEVTSFWKPSILSPQSLLFSVYSMQCIYLSWIPLT